MTDCICGPILNSATRVLVTHRLQFLSKVDKIVYLDQGEAVYVGNFANFIKASYPFAASISEAQPN